MPFQGSCCVCIYARCVSAFGVQSCRRCNNCVRVLARIFQACHVAHRVLQGSATDSAEVLWCFGTSLTPT